MKSKQLALALTLTAGGLLHCAPAHAVEDDRFHLRLGAVSADGRSDISGSTTFAGERFAFSEAFDYGSSEISPRIDGQFRISERNRVLFDYFRYDKDQRATLGRELSFDDISLPAGSFADIDTRFELASLVYDFAVLETETTSLGLQIGAE